MPVWRPTTEKEPRERERFPWWLGLLIALLILAAFILPDIPLLPRPR